MSQTELARDSVETTDQELQQFTDNLSTVQESLAAHGVRYSLVGGLAIKAILGEAVHPRRPNGTIIDFDGMAFGPNTEAIDAALSQLRPFSKGRVFPEVGIESCIFGPAPQPHTSPIELLSSLRVDDHGNFFLAYRDIEVEIPPETMEVRPRLLNGVAFPCFPAKTILFRYLTRGGIMKSKDDKKLYELEEYIVKHWDEEPSDHLYRPYLAFVETVRDRYPRAIWMYDAYWNIDQATGGRISGSKGIVYSLISNFRK